MINIWDQKLVEYFKTNLLLDKETEEIRKKLITTVSQQRLFEAIDKDANGFLTIRELSLAIQKLKKPFSLKNLRRMIKQYDKCGEFSLNYKDFGTFLLPKELTDDSEKKTEIDVNETNFELFIELVLKELEVIEHLSEVADEIKKTKEFITYEGFRAIAGTSKYITESNLKEYLIKKGVEVKDMNELAKIVYRYDKNFDGRFGYDEFKDIFSPNSNEDNDNVNVNINNSNININIDSQLLEKRIDNDNASIKKYDTIQLKNNKLSLQSYDETKEDSNFFSSRLPKNPQVLMYDYSFDQELPKDNDYHDHNHDLNNNNDNINKGRRLVAQFSSSSSIINPFKKSLNNVISLTKNRKVDISPLDRKSNYSNNDLANSNSMLNNSFINVSFSPNRTILMPQQSSGKDKDKGQKKIRNQTVFELSPLNEFKKQNSSNHSKNKKEKSSNLFSSIQISNNNKTYLLNYLKEIIVKELLCESVREEISKSSDINIPDLFSFFDNSHRIQISPSDFQESLKRISIIVTLDELRLLYTKYDKDHDGYLNYREFCEMILSKNKMHALNLSKHIPPVNYMELNSEAIHLVSNLFYSLFSCAKACESLRRENASRRDFSNVDCYELVKSKQDNTIFKKDMKRFLKENKVMLTSFEIDILMDYFDKDNDGEITFKEFVKEIAPRGIAVV